MRSSAVQWVAQQPAAAFVCGGKHRLVPASHRSHGYHAFLQAAGLRREERTPLRAAAAAAVTDSWGAPWHPTPLLLDTPALRQALLDGASLPRFPFPQPDARAHEAGAHMGVPSLVVEAAGRQSRTSITQGSVGDAR